MGVVPLLGSHTLSAGRAKGAFVNALAYASDEEEYKAEVRTALQELALEPSEYGDVERFSDRITK